MTRFSNIRLKGRGLAVVLASLFAFSLVPAFADNYAIAAIAYKSNDDLTNARTLCAFGTMANVFEKSTNEGVKVPSVDSYCSAVLSEAMHRELEADLYILLHRVEPFKEFHQMAEAATRDQNNYVNAVGETKSLTCALAYDVGYTYEALNPNELNVPDLPQAKLEQVRYSCFKQHSLERTLLGLVAGALDKRRIP